MEKKRIQFSAFGSIPMKDFEDEEKRAGRPFYHPAHWIYLEYHPSKVYLLFDPENDAKKEKEIKNKEEMEKEKRIIIDRITGDGIEEEDISLDRTQFWIGVKKIANELVKYFNSDYELIFDFSTGRRTITNMLMFAGLFIRLNLKNENVEPKIICVNKPSETDKVEFSLLPKEFDSIDYHIFKEIRQNPKISLSEIGIKLKYSQPTMSLHHKKIKTELLYDDTGKERILNEKGKNLGYVLDLLYEDEVLWPKNAKKHHKQRGIQVKKKK
jgi:hypothetical protein